MERTLLYGATVIILLFLHRLLIEPMAQSVGARAHIDLLMVEGWLIIGFILAWPPLRARFREAGAISAEQQRASDTRSHEKAFRRNVAGFASVDR